MAHIIIQKATARCRTYHYRRKYVGERVGDAVRRVAIRADGSGPGRKMAAATLAVLSEYGTGRGGVGRMIRMLPSSSVPITDEVQGFFGGDASCPSSIAPPTSSLAPPASPLASSITSLAPPAWPLAPPTESIRACASAKSLNSMLLWFFLAVSVKKICGQNWQ